MDHYYNLPEEQASVFDGITPQLIEASRGQRFANNLIDSVVYYIVFFMLVFILAIISGIIQVDLVGFIDDSSIKGKLTTYALAFAVLWAVYTLIEGLSKGRTLGKLITGTKAVREDGSPITFKDAMLRSLCRLIPFEALTIFGQGLLHDRISKTMVIKTR